MNNIKSNKFKKNIKKDIMVKVISGKLKNTEGKVCFVDYKNHKIKLKDLNLRVRFKKKFEAKTQKMIKVRTIEEGIIDWSNVVILNNIQ
jgi:ribosomal protein L24